MLATVLLFVEELFRVEPGPDLDLLRRLHHLVLVPPEMLSDRTILRCTAVFAFILVLVQNVFRMKLLPAAATVLIEQELRTEVVNVFDA